MDDEHRERGSAWAMRLVFAAVLLVFSELIVWQKPGEFSALDWLGIALVYTALAAVMLDVLTRFRVNEVFSLFLAAGIYGLVNATLVSGITTRELPLSLIVRPLGAQPLAFLAAVAALRFLARGQRAGLFGLLVSAGGGLAWGIWVRWFPLASDDPLPTVGAVTALAVVGAALIALLGLRVMLPRAQTPPRWELSPAEWAFAAGILAGALTLAVTQDRLATPGLPAVAGLLAFLAVILYATQSLRPPRPLLAAVGPAGRRLALSWLALCAAFLAAGWVGFHLPGSGDSSTQSDLLFGALTGFGIVWPPAVASLIGVKAWGQLARRGL